MSWPKEFWHSKESQYFVREACMDAGCIFRKIVISLRYNITQLRLFEGPSGCVLLTVLSCVYFKPKGWINFYTALLYNKGKS
jgi:hypothetical protein